MLRTCKSCLIEKPVQEFHYYNPDSPSYKCKPCHTDHERKRQKALWASNPDYRERHNLAGKMYRKGIKVEKVNTIRGLTTICKICKEEKNTEIDFHKRGNHYLRTCKICYNKAEGRKYQQKYTYDESFRKTKQLYFAKYRYKHKYNTTVETVLKTLELQENRCANPTCGVEISLTAPKELVKPAVVDHNHSTGEFRALLCQRCNTLLGHLEKDASIVEGLKKYLMFHTNSNKETH